MGWFSGGYNARFQLLVGCYSEIFWVSKNTTVTSFCMRNNAKFCQNGKNERDSLLTTDTPEIAPGTVVAPTGRVP